MILILHAHPYPSRSHGGRALLNAVSDLPNVEVRSLYALYPDFEIDVEAEQAALARAKLVVWLHPIYWYSVPAILKHYFDVVLLRGWAYSRAGGRAQAGDGDALRGKRVLWVATTGGTAETYAPGQMHAKSFDAFEAPLKQTAEFCGMSWEPPIALHGVHIVSENDIDAAAKLFRARLMHFASVDVHHAAEKK
jgi:glutathione-regulated potassium-efflux system ancillary protein KefF